MTNLRNTYSRLEYFSMSPVDFLTKTLINALGLNRDSRLFHAIM